MVGRFDHPLCALLGAVEVAALGIATLVRETPGAVDVGLSTRGQKPELNVRVNRGLAGTLGVNLGQLAAIFGAGEKDARGIAGR